MVALALLLGTGAAARAESLLGLDPMASSQEDRLLANDLLRAMVEEAKVKAPPRNGGRYRIGFANLEENVEFPRKVEEGIKANAEVAGIDLVVLNNRLNGDTALANADEFVRRQVDFVIEFQTDAQAGPEIMRKLGAAGIKVAAIDIPLPGAIFFGADNPRSGFMGGSYLAQAALSRWGAGKVREGRLVIGELPQSGVIPGLRTGGQEAGFLAVLPDFPREHILRIDGKNTLAGARKAMAAVLDRLPDGAPLMLIGINDPTVLGMLKAMDEAGRGGEVLAVGMGADQIDALVGDPRFIASVGFFPERYGNYLIPIALLTLAHEKLPPAVLVSHRMVTPQNVCEIYDEVKCAGPGSYPDLAYEFPAKPFAGYLARLRADPAMAGHDVLIPKE